MAIKVTKQSKLNFVYKQNKIIHLQNIKIGYDIFVLSFTNISFHRNIIIAIKLYDIMDMNFTLNLNIHLNFPKDKCAKNYQRKTRYMALDSYTYNF